MLAFFRSRLLARFPRAVSAEVNLSGASILVTTRVLFAAGAVADAEAAASSLVHSSKIRVWRFFNAPNPSRIVKIRDLQDFKMCGEAPSGMETDSKQHLNASSSSSGRHNNTLNVPCGKLKVKSWV